MNNERPNILLLMTDQQRYDALGCAGNGLIRTPNLDALAARGVRFSNACCPTPICVASRMSFITGQRASVHHWVANGALPGPIPELPTMMTLLHRAGYHTHGVGKMHFCGRHYGFVRRERHEECAELRIDSDYLMYLKAQGVRTRHPQGLRDLLYYQPQTSGIPLEHHPNEWVADRAIEALRDHVRYRSSKPLFLWTSWISPHPPFAPCEPYDSLYDPEDLPLPIHAERPLATLSSSAWGHRARLDGAHLDPDRIRRIRALYYGLVTHVDHAVGRVLAELDAQGLRDNTMVLFFSDHGDMLGDHGLSQKNVPYEPSVRVPMILSWPGRTDPGRVSDDLVGLTDVLPTLVEELGLKYPLDLPPLPGANLLGAGGGGLAETRDAYFIDYGSGASRWISLRTRTHKYAIWATGGFEELYDLEADPEETRNLIDREPALARDMRERALGWERTDGLSASLDGDELRRYRQAALPGGDELRGAVVNEGRWARNLPAEEADSVETYADAFTRAIAKEDTLSPEKLSLSEYRRKGGHPLAGTPWEDAWRDA